MKKGESKFDDKIKEIVGDCNGDDFLEMYEDICFSGNDRNDFYKYVGIKLGMFGIGKDKRNYIKELILYMLNGKEEFGKDKKYIENNYSYPQLGEFIFGKNGWKCINKINDFELNPKLFMIYFNRSNRAIPE